MTVADGCTPPRAGTGVALAEDEILIRRGNTRAGTVHVHFPRHSDPLRTED